MDVQCASCGRIEEMMYRGESATDAAKKHTCCGDFMHVRWAMPPVVVDNGPFLTSDRITRPHASKRAMIEHGKRRGLTYEY